MKPRLNASLVRVRVAMHLHDRKADHAPAVAECTQIAFIRLAINDFGTIASHLSQLSSSATRIRDEQPRCHVASILMKSTCGLAIFHMIVGPITFPVHIRGQGKHQVRWSSEQCYMRLVPAHYCFISTLWHVMNP